MAIRITCSDCAAVNSVSDENRGKRVKCKSCAEPISVPVDDEHAIQDSSRVKVKTRANGRKKNDADTARGRPETKDAKKPKKGAAVLLIVGSMTLTALLFCVVGVGGAGVYVYFQAKDPIPQAKLDPVPQPKAEPVPEPNKVLNNNAENEWVKFILKKDNCEILFPGKSNELPKMGRNTTQFGLKTDGGKADMMLSVSDFPNSADIENDKLVKLVLDGVRDELVRQFPAAKLVADNNGKIQKKYPSRELEMEGTPFGVYRVRCIVAPLKFYQVTVHGPREYVIGAEAKKFMESFRITATEPGEEWVKLALKKEKCEILFPGKPKELPQKDKNAKQFLLEMHGGDAAMLLNFNPFPNPIDIQDEQTVKLVMDRSRDALKGLFAGAKIVAETDGKINKKHPTRDVELALPKAELYRVRFILTASAFYQVAVAGPQDFVNGANSKKFVGSFLLSD